ncbi:MAG: histidine kinase [Acidobacteriota bacterium]
MHPILAKSRRLGLYLFVFLQAGQLLGELMVRTAGAPRLQAMVLAIPLLLIHSFTCLASWYVCRSLPLGATPPDRLLVAHAAAAALSGGLLIALGTAWAQILDGMDRFTGTMSFYRESVTLVFVFALLVFSLAVAVHYLFIASEASRAAEKNAFELQLLAREAELKALKAQIDPHFLFNSLNSISGLVTAAPEQARKMCVELAGFLRQSLRAGALEGHSLADELGLVESYLAVEQVRFADRLRVEWVRGREGLDCEVPPLILQPLVENAVRHGIAHLLEGGTVTLATGREGDRLVLTVENPCDPERPRANAEGIGLANVKQRLTATYGREADFSSKDAGDRFRVTLTLPARRTAAHADTPTEALRPTVPDEKPNRTSILAEPSAGVRST